MESPSTRRHTILFVDVVASTELYESLGDADARARMAPCLTELDGLIESHGGTVVKSLGDGILAAFDDECRAVDSALTMPAAAARHALEVTVGVHAGEVLVEEGDVFGQAVNTASRLSAMAQPSEILITSDILGCLSPMLRKSARRLQSVAIKGLRDPLELFALGHAGPAATMSVSADFPRGGVVPSFGIEIRQGGRTWSVGPRSTLRLGRDPANDLVVDGDRVSRKHATITNRRGRYVLVDQSVNGTWLMSGDGTRVHLLREEATLVGAGEILLGVPPEHPLAEPISYRTLAA